MDLLEDMEFEAVEVDSDVSSTSGSSDDEAVGGEDDAIVEIHDEEDLMAMMMMPTKKKRGLRSMGRRSTMLQQENTKRIKLTHVECPTVHCVGSATSQGARNAMEDFVTIIPDLSGPHMLQDGPVVYVGVFDGHNGEETSRFLHENLHERISANWDNENKSNVLTQCFRDADLELLDMVRNSRDLVKPKSLRMCKSRKFAEENRGSKTSLLHATPTIDSGSAATVALLEANKLHLAWLGDCRAVLSRAKTAIPLTRDHRVEDEAEKSRVCAAGGVLTSNGRLFHEMNLSRAFASFRHKLHSLDPRAVTEPNIAVVDRALQLQNPLTADPETRSLHLSSQDEFLIVASDGLWDSLSNQAAVDIVRSCLEQGRTSTDAAEELTRCALQHTAPDNISVVVMVFQKVY